MTYCYENCLCMRYAWGVFSHLFFLVIFVWESGWLQLYFVRFLLPDLWQNPSYAGDCRHHGLQQSRFVWQLIRSNNVHKRDFQTSLQKAVDRWSSKQKCVHLLEHRFRVYTWHNELTSFYAKIQKCDVKRERCLLQVHVLCGCVILVLEAGAGLWKCDLLKSSYDWIFRHSLRLFHTRLDDVRIMSV